MVYIPFCSHHVKNTFIILLGCVFLMATEMLENAGKYSSSISKNQASNEHAWKEKIEIDHFRVAALI